MHRSALLLALTVSALFAEDYALGPDSQRQTGVPEGKVSKFEFKSPKIYPNTTRDYWVYVPAQYDAAKPACLMIFQDGGGYMKDDGSWRVPIVFDNLIAKKEMPVTIGIFVNPGVMNASSPDQQNRYNRSYEYDGLGDRYARFLIEELIPEVAKSYNISSNPDDRALGGLSSGGIASFNAAWTRPEAFHRVLCSIGSYTDLRGGDMIEALIRKTEPKPLRVFLQDGDKDLNIYAGNWWLANQGIFSALEYSGYETKFVTGTLGHSAKQGGSILPDSLRWLWEGYPRPVGKPAPKDPNHFVNKFLDPASDWELVGEGYKFTEGPAIDPHGNVYFVDVGASKILKVVDGKISVFKEDAGGTSGLMFDKNGTLYAAQNGKKRIVAYAPDGSEKVLAEDVNSNDLAVSSKGNIYFSDPPGHRVWLIDASGAKHVVHEGIPFPNGVRFSPDESLLVVADSWTRWVYSFQVQADGSLANGEPFYRLEMPERNEPGLLRSGADGIAMDTEGFAYVATYAGIQVCDQPGRVNGIIRTPGTSVPSNLVFAGPDMQTLYVTIVDKVYKRHLRRKGFYPWQPVKPTVPHL